MQIFREIQFFGFEFDFLKIICFLFNLINWLINFLKIAAVYEILRSTDRRAIYDQILGEGLPDWRRPVYYYR